MPQAVPLPPVRTDNFSALQQKPAIGKPAVYKPVPVRHAAPAVYAPATPALQRKQAPGPPPVYRASALPVAAPPVYSLKAAFALQQKSSAVPPPAYSSAASVRISRYTAPPAPAAAIQRYTVMKDGKGKLASSGDVVVRGKRLFATTARIEDSNKQLSAAGPHGAMIKLVKKGAAKRTDEAPGKDLFEVVPEVNISAYHTRMAYSPESFHKGMNMQKEGEPVALWADCRRTAELVTGASSGLAVHDSLVKVGGEALPGYTGAIERPSGIKNDSTTGRLAFQVYTSQIPQFLAKYNYKLALFQPTVKEHFPELNSVSDLNEEVFTGWVKKQAGLAGTNISIAERLYASMKLKAQLQFDKEAGINEYANPEIGDAYSTVTEYGMPGFKESGDDWGFHWGGVVMKGGTDNITLENLSVSKERVRNTDWFFAMYGTADASQSFHQHQLLSGHHGTVATTIAVETVGSRESRQLLSLREKLNDLKTMEARTGVDYRVDILKAAVQYNKLAESRNQELLTAHAVLGGGERAFTVEDKQQIHSLMRRWIPV